MEKGVDIGTRNDLIKLTTLCMKQNYFQFEEKIFHMTTGTAMGNALSPFLAEIFMASFEREMAANPLFPKLWIRYVDDVFAVVRTKLATKTLELLNSSRHTTIKFTMETEVNGSLPFLDILVQENDVGK